MKRKQSIWDFLAETLGDFPDDSKKQEVIRSINRIIEYFSDLRERIRALPDSTQRSEIMAAVEIIREFTESAKDNPAVAAALGIVDKASGRARASRIVLPDLAGEKLFSDLKSLPTQEIQERLLDFKRTSMPQLRALAIHLGIKNPEKAKRDDLVDRIVKLGFANVRGYEMLRSEKKAEG